MATRRSDGERESLLRRALLLPARPAFGAFRLRPFSLWTLDLCEEIGLDFFLRLPPGMVPAGSRSYQLAALVWFHDEARPADEVDAALASGAWRSEVAAFVRDPSLASALDGILDYVAYFARLIDAAAVRVKPRPKRRGERVEKDPANLLEPGQAFALLWTITGGAIQGLDHLRALYRETPLPVVLSLYHCALRAALVWTLPPRRAKADAAKQAAAKAARETVLRPSARRPVDFL